MGVILVREKTAQGCLGRQGGYINVLLPSDALEHAIWQEHLELHPIVEQAIKVP